MRTILILALLASGPVAKTADAAPPVIMADADGAADDLDGKARDLEEEAQRLRDLDAPSSLDLDRTAGELDDKAQQMRDEAERLRDLKN